jgi:hypothetical protein
MSQVVNLEQVAGIDPAALRQGPEVHGNKPLPGKVVNSEMLATFHSYHGTTEHSQSDTDYSVTEASSTSTTEHSQSDTDYSVTEASSTSN